MPHFALFAVIYCIMRIMGLDYGDKTVGVALSDELLLTAQPLETIHRERSNKLRQTLARLEELMVEYDVERIVIGLPKKMNNEEGERCRMTREFGGMVERRSGLEVVYQDERLTTVSADSVLEEGGVRRKNRKEYVDGIAAAIILKSYLDGLN